MEKTLEERIKSTQLTKMEKKVATYFVENTSGICFMSGKDIALAMGISDTSVIRPCRSLGYRGFVELQNEQKALLSKYVDGGKYVIPQNQVTDKMERFRESENIVCLKMAIKNLQMTFEKNAPEKFIRAAEIVYESDHIFVAGFRGLSGSAVSLGVIISQYVQHVDYSGSADTACIEKVMDYGPNDCVILMGVERYSNMSCTLADIARENGSRLIAIVDKITAPIAYEANLVLISDFESPLAINSFIGTQLIIETIAFEMSKLTGISQKRRLSRLNDNLNKLGLY